MTKMNDMMWVHQNKEPADSGGVLIGAAELPPPNQVPQRRGSIDGSI